VRPDVGRVFGKAVVLSLAARAVNGWVAFDDPDDRADRKAEIRPVDPRRMQTRDAAIEIEAFGVPSSSRKKRAK
jgi:hypothetical protein